MISVYREIIKNDFCTVCNNVPNQKQFAVCKSNHHKAININVLQSMRDYFSDDPLFNNDLKKKQRDYEKAIEALRDNTLADYTSPKDGIIEVFSKNIEALTLIAGKMEAAREEAKQTFISADAKVAKDQEVI